MKKTLLTLILCLSFIVTGCSSGNEPGKTTVGSTAGTTARTESQTQTTEGSTEPALPSAPVEKSIDRMEDLAGTEDIISVEKIKFSSNINGAVAYRVLFESEGVQLEANFALPGDYTRSGKNYPVLLYFPEVPVHVDNLATFYAQNGVIVARLFYRGWSNSESEGIRDLGGQHDLADAQKLQEICCRTSFMEDSKMFAIGSSEGSIRAMRLFAEDSEHRLSGCAVVSAITDLPAFAEYRGEGIKSLHTALIGKTYEEAPEEYDLRSAVKFYEKLADRPILLIHYTQSSDYIPAEQPEALYDLLKEINEDCTYYPIDDESTDFIKESLKILLSWVNKHV